MFKKKTRLYHQVKKTNKWTNYKHFQKEFKSQVRKAEWAVSMDFWYIIVSPGASCLAHSFNILFGMLSGPEALEGFIFLSNFSIPSDRISRSGIDLLMCFKHMLKHLERHKVLISLNHGFRSGYSCETQLLVTLHDFMKSYDAGLQIDVAILDFSKAFDTVPHNKLLHKLDDYGLRGSINRWLEMILTQRNIGI
jgi:hypothetical protein